MAKEIDIQKLIKQVTEEVLKRLEIETEPNLGTLAVMPEYVFDPKGVQKYLKEKHPNVTCALFSDAEFSPESCVQRHILTAQDKRLLAGELKYYENIVVVTPTLAHIKALSLGDDSVYEAMLGIRPLLWGSDVTVLLDFEAPRYRRSTAFAHFADDLDALEKTGFKIASLPQKKRVADEAKELLTEQDVKEAYQNGLQYIRIKKDAIVTQLATDTAKELNIAIEF